MIGSGLLLAFACRDDPPPQRDDNDEPEPLCDGGGSPFGEGELFGSDVTFVDATDWDADGDIDVFVRHLDLALGMYENVGGSWSPYRDMLAAGGRDRLVPIGVLDLDEDADADVLSMVRGSPLRWPYNNILTLHERLDGDFLAAPIKLVSDIDCFEPYVLVDADGDGDQDLFCMAAAYPYGLVWLENQGGGSFGDVQPVGLPWAPRFADLDADGDTDFLYNASWVENIGEGTYGWTFRRLPYDGWPFDWGGLLDVVRSAPGDLDGDGDLDIVAFVWDVYNDAGPLEYVGWWSNQGDGRFAPLRGLMPFSMYGPDYAPIIELDTSDLDGDGDDDVLYGDSGTRLLVLEAIGNGVLRELHSVPFADGFGHASLHVADLDGDRDADILSAHTPNVPYDHYDPYAYGMCDDGEDCGLYRFRNQLSGAPDGDHDGTCDQDDRCPGFHDGSDTDGDGIPNGCDSCDSPIDTDGDGRSDDCDTCPGTPDDIDGDLDGVSDVCDPCPTDAVDDSDGDGVCDSEDVCLGYDASGDVDDDGICNNLDACDGDNSSGDSDADHVCNDLDVCPDHPDLVDDDGDDIPDDCDDVVYPSY